MKEHFNLKEIFNHPITIYKFGKYRLPFGISLVRIVVGIVILLVMLVFRRFFLAFDEIMRGMSLLLFIGIPFLLSGYLVQKTYEGKKIQYYVYDFSNYFMNIYVKKTKYCNDEVVEYMDCKQIKIEQVVLERERKADETKKRVPRRLQEPHVNSEGGNNRTLQS
ncbi:conjugal transfer protein [Bacillus mycoides]|uniref:conjugal transfer protein n=1 Tax=Bacillus mycoides TaxID=1405 RepID=UPI001C02E774|nr:conjugal transfer protein [Bacillus mycoides]MED1380952.1 conjugal transfer protein [Bacillus mycoides]QWH75358.1 conjugal transfer protein [Bacillus mycoides]QWI47285.1 conjugal transfer protein [Bacillus mycoides]